VVGIATLALAAPSAALADASRQTATLRFSTATPGAPAGISFAADFHDPADPNAKPHALTAFDITLPAGTVIDFGAIPQCTASDAELQLEGTAACPAASRLATGTLITDTGSPAGFPRYATNQLNQFNGNHELITISDSVDPQGFRTVGRSPVAGTTIHNTIPPFPGAPPPEPLLAFRKMTLAGAPGGDTKRPWLRTPPTCPRARAWTTRMTFTYVDGVTQATSATSPCDPRQRPARRAR
jgi:hypothetical protein